MSVGGTVRILGGSGVGSGVGCPSHSGGYAPVPSHLQCVCGFSAVPSWQGRQPSGKLSRTRARCHAIAALSLICPGNATPCFISL